MRRTITETDRGLLHAVAVVRWLALVWAIGGLAVSGEHLTSPVWAWCLIGAAAALTATLSWWRRHRPDRLLMPAVVAIELAVAAALLLGDGLVYANTRPQSLPWAWPAAGLATCGIVLGVRWAVAAALSLGVASFIGEGLNDAGATGWDTWGVTASSKAGLYLLAALTSAAVARRLRAAEHEIGIARAREEVAAQLHDGVLQTLAVIQRRSDDRELVELARDQDRDLRRFLAGGESNSTDLASMLHEAGALFERRYRATADIIIADDAPEPPAATANAIAGAVGEALANAGKHGGASRATVYVEPSPAPTSTDSTNTDQAAGLFVSINDTGTGFDPTIVAEGFGVRHSIRQRIEAAGGRVEISSRPNRGTEVRLWVPWPKSES